jgi:cysteine synthase
MPETMSVEYPGTVMLDQFTNPANAEVHRQTTAVAKNPIC